MRKIIALFIVTLFIGNLSACGSSNSNSTANSNLQENQQTKTYKTGGTSKSEAIEIAKKRINRSLLSKYGFNSDARITYGECTAESSNGSLYRVILRGNIIGTDKYGLYKQETFVEYVNNVFKD